MQVTLRKRYVTFVKDPDLIMKFVKEGFEVLEIDGDPVVGTCDACGIPVTEKNVFPGHECTFCKKCREEAEKGESNQ